MKKNIKISVITPFYNTVKSFGNEDALIRCLDSFSINKDETIEFIFIDNNSEDESRNIIESYIKKDSRFKIFTEDKKGVSNARNLGLKKAKGEYITFVDSDDYIGNNYFEEALGHINKCAPDILIGDFTVCLPDGNTAATFRKKALKKHKKNIKTLFPFIECPHNVFFKREIVQAHKLKQNPNIRVGEDNLFNAQIMQHCRTVRTLKSKEYFYQVYEGSSSNVKSDKFLDFIDAYDEILEIYMKKYGSIDKAFLKYLLKKKRDFSNMLENCSVFDEKLLNLLNKYNIDTSKFINTISTKDISVVVQGAVNLKDTTKCLKSIRKHLPEATIILSTWEGTNVEPLECLFDKVVFSKDPGFTYYIKEDIGKLNNVNRQIVSSKAGLLAVKTKYALKFRTDLYLTGSSFLDFFDKYNEYTDDFKVVEKRMLSCTKYARNPRDKYNPYPMHASDILFFGLSSDVLKVFNIDLMSAEDLNFFNLNNIKEKHGFRAKYLPEQYIWISFLKYKKLKSISAVTSENIKDSELSFLNNLVLLSPYQFNTSSNKRGLFSFNAYSCYTHYNWLKMYKKNINSNLKISYVDMLKHLVVFLWDLRYRFLEFIFRFKKTERKIIIKILKIPVFSYNIKNIKR